MKLSLWNFYNFSTKSISRIKSVAIGQSDYFPEYLFPFEEKLVRMLCYLLQPEQKNIISIDQNQYLNSQVESLFFGLFGKI